MKSLLTWRKTISGKLTIIYAAMFFIVLIILNGAVLLGLRYLVLNSAENNLDYTMDYVLARVNLGPDIYEDIEQLEQISQSGQNIYFRILSPHKKVIAQSNVLKGSEIPVEQGYNELEINGRSFIYKSGLIIKLGRFNGYLQAFREVTLEYRFLRVLFTILTLTSLLGGVGAVFIGYTVTRRTLKPIKLLTDTARNLSVSELGKRLEIEGPEDELTDLARTFNSMLERLEDAFKHQQQFVSDASHELRTPISVIQGYINLLDRWGKNEPEVRDEAIESIKKEVENMNSLVESLLFLARGQSDRLDIKKTSISLKELFEEIVKEAEMLSRGIKVLSQVDKDIELVADRKLIKQMLRIFVDNSLKYTPAGGEIKLEAVLKDNEVKLIISDTGIGIPENELPHIFDRFYQVDKARSEKKGTGLGLSIARWIIEKHHGKVQVESSPGEGTAIIVNLPAESDQPG